MSKGKVALQCFSFINNSLEEQFDQEKVWEIERYNIREEGREEGIRQLIQRMLANASIREVSGITGYSEEEINRILKT